MLDDVSSLLKKYRNDEYNEGIAKLGKSAKKQIEDFYHKLEVNFRNQGIFKSLHTYKTRTYWKKPYDKKIVEGFDYVLKHNDYSEIGSTISVFFEIKSNELIATTAITMEYTEKDDAFDPIIQSSLQKYKTKFFKHEKHKNKKYEWDNLLQDINVKDYQNENDLIIRITESIVSLTKIFNKIIQNLSPNENIHINCEFEEWEKFENTYKQKEVKNKNGFGDYLKRQIQDKKIGDFFEKKVLEKEQERVIEFTNKVPKRVDGDGYGYDLISYDENGEEIFIEVKGTFHSCSNVFYLTANEILAAKKYPDKWFLYRVYKKRNEYPIVKISARYVIENFLNTPTEYAVALG